MSGPVDVMEWMRQCAPDEVLAAVAELIEASDEYFTGYCVDEADDDCATGSGFDTGCTLEQHDAAKRLRAALARVQGGAP